ncbi:Endonuclease/exonuclease/phosphatase [Lipomyces orientalis]|uniref:Endonuclease/exonuclease/phosphatase n=1 Tax=Lipomyces orientalis TaxID=1233043 RepID=A0ACC3TFV2_9ASCO
MPEGPELDEPMPKQESSSSSAAAAAKRKKGGGRPDFVTPEYIAAQRAKREQAKADRARRNAELGISVPAEPVFDTNFRKRPMLSVCGNGRRGTERGGFVDVKIMTYNVLGQALIRRKLFPTNGEALKWRWRSKMLLAELTYYDADIMCLQEVDLAHMDTFYEPELRRLGYEFVFHRGEGKNHGLALCWKTSLCSLVRSESVDYDNDNGYDPADVGARPTTPQARTRNVACLVGLKFNQPDTGGVVVGTTHLFWHPHGTFERTRQAAVLVRNAKTFAAQIDGGRWPVFLAGDFNSLPFDSPYLCLTKPKETRNTGHSYEVLRSSWEHEYKKKQDAADEGEDEEDEDEEETDMPEAGEPKMLVEFGPDRTSGPVADRPETAVDGSSRRSTIDEIMRLHDNNRVLLRSLYGGCYRYVHAANADVEVRNGEPAFSNWAFTWRGLLDYIFVVEYPGRGGTGDRGEIVEGVKVVELLRLPEPAEMGDEPSGQPREGQYPSDHLCLMATVRLGQRVIVE